MIQRVDHVAIAVWDLEEGLRLYRDSLGLNLEGSEEVPGEKVRVAFLEAGNTRVELLVPLGKESEGAKFLEKKGPGVHHVAFRVEDIQKSMQSLEQAGYQFAGGNSARPGSRGTQVCFLHPKTTLGALIELVQ